MSGPHNTSRLQFTGSASKNYTFAKHFVALKGLWVMMLHGWFSTTRFNPYPIVSSWAMRMKCLKDGLEENGRVWPR
ncbi:hypothetical protein SUGI_0181850 [Cryptomeria japonica]|nr:hypothetical protein SUGI_0181850 [Cryptomeria japonica]